MAGLGFDDTELRLGLPGGDGANDAAEASAKSSGKRSFADTIDLKLKLQPAAATVEDNSDDEEAVDAGVTAAVSTTSLAVEGKMKRSPSQASVVTAQPDPEKPREPKAQAVGWPPVRSFRKNVLAVQAGKGCCAATTAAFVKVSMDGAPYLRKVDLSMYKSYQELSMALQKMFGSFNIGKCGSKGMKAGLDESKLNDDLINGSDYVPTFEDKDGDWMLVGDVPWEMFVESCKRLRITKGSEAIGLAPRTMEKCKSRG